MCDCVCVCFEWGVYWNVSLDKRCQITIFSKYLHNLFRNKINDFNSKVIEGFSWVKSNCKVNNWKKVETKAQTVRSY